MDKAVTPLLGDVQRSLVCVQCQEEGKPGYFSIKKCSEKEHTLGEEIKACMKEKEESFKMRNILDMDNSKLGLQPFQSSEIKKDMLSGRLNLGEHVWVYHDTRTNPCNPVARFNTYAQ